MSISAYTPRRLYFSLLLIFLPILLFARKDVRLGPEPSWLVPRNPDLVKPPSEKEVNFGYFFRLYDEQVNAEKGDEYFHYIKKIVNETGIEDNAQIKINFSAEYNGLIFHHINIIRNGQRLNKLDLSRIKIIQQESNLSDHLYDGMYQALIILDDIRKGDEVEVAYSIEGDNPIFKKFTSRFSFVHYSTVINYYTSIVASPSRKLNFRTVNAAKMPERTVMNGLDVYNWSLKDVPAYNNEKSNTPSWHVSYPYVEVSEYKNWNDVATWTNELSSNYNLELPVSLNQKIKEWKKQSKGDVKLFAEKATRFVQDEIRYLGMETGEYTHRPHPPTVTYNNRFGDCKDKSLLLACILRQEGIPSFMVLVDTDYRDHISDHLPGSNLFDHVIVKMILEKKEVWVDPTISMQKGPITETFLPFYGKGLLVNNAAQEPETITQRTFGRTEVTESITVPNENDEKGRLEVVSHYYSGDADQIRRSFSAGIKDLEKGYEEYYSREFGKAKLDKGISLDDSMSRNMLTVRESYLIDSIWQEDDGKMSLDVYARMIVDKLVKPDPERPNLPMSLVYPADLTYTAVINFPKEWTVEGDAFEIKNDAYYFSFGSDVSDNTVTLRYHFKTFKDHLTPEEALAYKKDYDRMWEVLVYNFSWDKTLSRSVSTPAQNTIAERFNWVTLFIGLCALAGAFFLLRYLGRGSSVYTSQHRLPDGFNVWQIFLGLVLAIRIMVYTYQLITTGYFSTSTWLLMNDAGSTGMQLFLLIDMIVQLSLAVYGCFVFYWFMMKRDIFPRMFIALAMGELIINLAVLFVGVAFQSTIARLYPGYGADAGTAVMRSIVFVGIWVSLMMKAPSVQYVFIRPYEYKSIRTFLGRSKKKQPEIMRELSEN